MRYIATMALMLNLGVASVYAQHYPVKMTFSGTAASTPVNLQYPNTVDDEENYAGIGTLGSFTLRNVRAATTFPQTSSTCSGPNKIAFQVSQAQAYFGSGIESTEGQSYAGNRLHDLAAGQACVWTFSSLVEPTFQGCGRLLTLTETVVPVVDALTTLSSLRGVAERCMSPPK
jgi:hypothetical protein